MKATDTTIPIVGIDKKIPFKEKLLFSLTPGLGTFYLAMISTWLLFYYTDILKINDAFVGVMFVVVRVADAIITPIFGVYLDRQNTRWGKYKPWMLIIWAGMAVGGFLTFCPVNFGQLGNTIYATVTYIIYSIFISMNQAPTMGMTASMTKRQDDRMTISTQNFIWTVVFTLLVSAASLPLINLLGNGNQGDGFRNFMSIFMIIGIFLILVIVKVIKERFVFSSNENQKLNVKAIWDSLIKNKYAMIAVLINFSINIFNGVRSAIGIYYYKYFFNDTNMMVIVGTLSLVPMLIGVFFSSVITKKLV
ncbi:hypothetical protein GA838_06770 [Oenococcus oeni]|uniref:MFS transporter n=2 Tax=Oenococcus oeni TaxID=1247 RepID=A0AAJ2UBT6_OENOE|nr:hypothetical protein [Oenococcus oeni]